MERRQTNKKELQSLCGVYNNMALLFHFLYTSRVAALLPLASWRPKKLFAAAKSAWLHLNTHTYTHNNKAVSVEE